MDLHEELSRHGQANTADAVRHLRNPSTESWLAGRVVRGRRRRAMGASALAFAAVGALVLAVAVVPGWGNGQHLDEPASSQRWLDVEQEINWNDGGEVVDAPFVLGPRMTIGEATGDPLTCGAPWDYESGAYVHDARARQQIQGFVASAAFWHEGERISGPPTAMTPEHSMLLWEFAYRQAQGGPGVEFQVGSVAVADGVILGRGIIGGGAGGGVVSSSDVAPFPGECPGLAPGEKFMPYIPTDDGVYEQHLVVQFVHATTYEPMATFVDPAGSFVLEYAELDTLANSRPVPAQTSEQDS